MRKLGSIILGAQPGTAIHHALHGGWTPEAHLLANQLEQRAGVLDVQRRIPRPGVPADAPQPRPEKSNRLTFDALPLEEFERLRQENYAKGPAESRVFKPAQVARKG